MPSITSLHDNNYHQQQHENHETLSPNIDVLLRNSEKNNNNNNTNTIR